jgi:hypothetical protein
LKENEIRQKQAFADIVYFDLVYPSEKKREISNRGQKMSTKVCQRTYSRDISPCDLCIITGTTSYLLG